MWGDEPGGEETVSVFCTLKTACKELAEVSFKIRIRGDPAKVKNREGQTFLSPVTCYSRMMWSKCYILELL